MVSKVAPNDGQLTIEDAKIVFRNFAGKEGMYNAEGDRNFCVLLDDELAKVLAADGWNIKTLKAREEGDDPQAYIQVSVKYRGRNGNTVRPPTIFMVTSKGRTALSEDVCEVLDWVDIAKVDLIIRPFTWAVSGKTGVKAYLKALYITIQEDELQLKYADVPEITSNGALAIEAHDPNIIDAEFEEHHELIALEG